MQFKIAVNEPPEKIVFLMESKYKILRLSAETYFMSGNVVEIYYNDDYDKILSTGEDGWFYYNTHMDFFPIDDEITVSREIEIAENIKNFFDSCCIRSEIIFDSDEYQT